MFRHRLGSFFVLLKKGLVLLPLFFVVFAIAIIFSAPKSVSAAAFNDAATGNWNIGTTWGGACASSCVAGTDFPAANDTVTIDSHTVTLTATHLASTLTISGGTLNMGAQTLTVTGNVTISSGTFNEDTGTFNIGNGSNSAQPTINVATSETFYNLTVNLFSNASVAALSSDTYIVTNTFTHTNGLINSGTISARGSVSIGSGADGGSASILFDQTGDQVITSAGGTTLALDINKSSGTVSVSGATLTTLGFTLQSGTFTAPTTLNLIGNLTVSGGSFVEGTNTVSLGNGSNSNNIAVNVDTSETFYNLTVNLFSNSNTLTITSGDTLIASNTYTHTNGQINTGTISARGAITIGSSADGGTGVILLDQTGDQAMTVSGGVSPELRINKSSGTVTATGTLTLVKFTLQSGTFVAPSTLTLRGNFTVSGGTFTEGTGTVNFGDGGLNTLDVALDVVNSETFYIVNVNLFTASQALTISSGDTMIVTNTFTHTNGDINTGTIRAEGDVSIGSGADGGTAALTFDGSANQTYTDSGGDEVDGTFTVNKDSGTLTLASAMTVNATGQDLVVSGGTLDLAGFALTVTDQFTISSGGTLELFGSESITVSGAKNINTGSTVVFTGDDDNASDSYTPSDLSTSYYNLTINSSDGDDNAFRVGGLTVTNDFTNLAGTNNGSSGTVTVGGDWDNAGTNSELSIELNGTDQTVSGGNSFVNFTKTDSNNNGTDLTLTFEEGTTLTVTDTFTITGTDDNDRVNLVSSDPGTAWLLSAAGSGVDWAYVEDSDASSNNMINHTNTEDGGGNTNWGFNGDPSVGTLGPASYVNGSFGTDTTPTLTFTTADVDELSDTVKFHIQVDDSNDFSSAVVDYTSALGAAGASTFTVGQAAGTGSYTTGTSGQTLSDGSYYWRLRAIDEHFSTSTYATANSGSIAFKIDTTAPTTGTVSVGSAATDSLTATIAGASDAGSGLATNPYQFNETVTGTYSGATSSTSWIKTGLSPNVQYTFRAGVYDVLGNSGTTSSATKYTLANPPASLSISSDSSSQLTLTWLANSNPAGTEYYVENTTAGVNSGWITDLSLVSTGLTANTSYTFTVKARNGDAVETSTITSSASTLAASSPSSGSGSNRRKNGRCRFWIPFSGCVSEAEYNTQQAPAPVVTATPSQPTPGTINNPVQMTTTSNPNSGQNQAGIGGSNISEPIQTIGGPTIKTGNEGFKTVTEAAEEAEKEAKTEKISTIVKVLVGTAVVISVPYSFYFVSKFIR